MDKELIKQKTIELLKAMDLDLTNPELSDTPRRLSNYLLETLEGFKEPNFKMTKFSTKYQGMVVRPFIPFTSYCQHHCLPYTGFIHFSYFPNGEKLGASKIIRFFQHYTKKLSCQEELTQELVEKFNSIVKNNGIFILISGNHMCEACRGIAIKNVPFITALVTGWFLENKDGCKDEVYQIILTETQRR